MCGRSRCALAPEQVEQAAGVQPGRWTERERYRPSYNVQPGHWTPIVRLDEQQQGRMLQTMKWGLVPSFTKQGETPDHFRMFNARSETVTEKPVFSRLLTRQRCVVLLEGFYEWKADAGGKKQPYFVSFEEGAVMRMAGLYDVWAGGADGPLATYTIMTVDASPKLTWLHNRMPVLLQDDAAVEAWLGDSSNGSEQQRDEQQQQHHEEGVSSEEGAEGAAAVTKAAAAGGGKASAFKIVNQLCVPCNSDALKWHPVTPAMSKPSYDNPDASRDVRTKKGSIGTFFKPAVGPDAAAAAAGGGGDGGKAAKSPLKQQQQQHVHEAAADKASSPAAKQADPRQHQQHHHQQQHQQQQHHQQQHKASPGVKMARISSFFKPVGSPAGSGGTPDKQQHQQQQQQQQPENAVRNADEQSGPSPADNAAAAAAGSAGKRAAAAPAKAAAAKKAKVEA